MSSVFYQHEVRNLTYSELRRMCDGAFETMITWGVKTLRLPLKIPSGIRYPEDLILVKEGSLPSHIADRVNRNLPELRSAGVDHEFFYKIQTIGAQEIYGWSGCFARQATVAVYNITRYDEQTKIDEKIEFELQSELADGRVLVTSNQRNLLDCPENFEYEWFKNFVYADLLSKHADRLVGAGSKPKPVNATSHESQMLNTLLCRIDRLIERNVFRAMPEPKLKALRK